MRLASSTGKRSIGDFCTRADSCWTISGAASPRRHNKSNVSRILALLLLTSLFLAGCSGGKDKKAAAEAINKGLRREAVALPLFLGRVSHTCTPIVGLDENQDLTTVTEYHAAQKAGLITITPDGAGFWKVELVNPRPDLAENLKKFPHTVKGGCDDLLLTLGVASKSVAEIVSIHDITSEKAETEFTWKWVLTPAGEKLVNGLSEQERIQTNAHLENPNTRLKPDPTFSLANMTQSSTPRPGKTTLKKSGDSWVLDE